jgi:predicted deacylase
MFSCARVFGARPVAGSGFGVAILVAACTCGCAPQARTVEPAQPVDFRPHSPQGLTLPAGATGASARRTLDVGRSAEGRPLVLEVFGSGPGAVLVIGGIHGNETRGVDLARRLADYLAAHPEAACGRTVAVLADANPDGAARHTRANASGVDLNRNFSARNWRPGDKGRMGYGGPAPASEPETRAILRAIEILRPDRIVSLHTTSRDQACNNFDGPAEGLARLMAARNGYPVLANIGHPTPGSLGNWAGVDRGLPVITLELPENQPGPACWEHNRTALLEAISADDLARRLSP